MIGIIGSGNVGANTAFFLAEKGVDHVILYDVEEGMAKGKALDMMEAAPIRGYGTSIIGTDDPEQVLQSDLIIITAGSARQPGMKRDALFHQNKDMVASYADMIQKRDTKVIIVAEPVDVMTTLFVRRSSLPAQQVMGLGGILDATRLRFMIAEALGVSMENVSAQVIGRHTDDMVILGDYCGVSGIGIHHFFSDEKIEELIDRTRHAGHLIVELTGRASAYYGPSAVAAEVAEAVRHDTGRLMSVSHVLSGQFGIEGQALSLPCVVHKTGITRVIEPVLTEEERQILKRSAQMIENTLKEADHA